MKNVSLNFQTLLRFACIAAIATVFAACTTEQDVVSQEDTDLVLLDATAEDAFADAEEVSFEALEMTDESIYGRTFQTGSARALTNACVTITNDSVNRVLTIDFGTGCVGPDGRTRSGQIVIDYTRRLYWPGATLSVSLVNYMVDSVAIAGTKTYTNLMQNFRDTLSLNVTLSGGSMTLANGNSATRSFTRTTTWVRGANPALDEFWVDGSLQGSRFNGNAFTRTINNTLVFRRGCRRRGVHNPVEGTVTITRSNGPNIEVDFGNGACDTFADVTVNGNTRTIDLSQR
ncbi:MAG: hypothetical protein MRZ79_24965 [Bacteroidia bacterium]|nr:hypothetical protein [Bacteroidia bacterium]